MKQTSIKSIDPVNQNDQVLWRTIQLLPILVDKGIMQILKKYQLKGVAGFQSFVQNLEQMTPEKRQDIIQLASLEDPVYILWIIKNLYSIDKLFELGSDYFPDVYEESGEKMELFVRAFHGTNYEQKFLEEILHEKLRAQWDQTVEYMGDIPAAVQQVTQMTILEKIRTLQKKEVLKQLRWDIPSGEILTGILSVPTKGPWKKFYQPGMLALEGNFQDKMREGEWKHYYPENKIMAKGFYHQNEKIDEWTFWHPNQEKMAHGVYKDNLREGEWTLWDNQGQASVVHYQRGRIALPKAS